ncbi:MAG: hypothetical protein KBT29_02370 [Prevotellaceae bacterium]|nr:hypothetical protein [Candidatus Minthosoma caballi]
MRKVLHFYILPLLAILFSIALVSCGDDEGEAVPSYITDFLLAETGSNGNVKRVVLDDGTEYAITSQQIAADKADSAYRCIATYTKSDRNIKLYSLESVFSALPQDADSFCISRDSLPRDAVKMLSIWKGRGYINMLLGVMTTGNKNHKYAFSIDSIKDNTEHVSLVHQRPKEDAESYTDKVYMSMPMQKTEDNVKRFVFHVNTYDGWKEYSFD